MAFEIKILDEATEGEYEALLSAAPSAMFNHSIRYRNFLRRVLPEAKDHYFLAYRDGEIVAALPTFSRAGPLGLVVNSLPFYGSHGGVVVREGYGLEVKIALLSALREHCVEIGAVLSTVIEPSLNDERESYSTLQADYFDDRIGQITVLPSAQSEDVGAELLALYHQKTRNLVRKGLKGGFRVSHTGSRQAFHDLQAMHEQNMRAIGGVAKPREVFDAIVDEFQYGYDFRIYLAYKGDHLAAALLVFYFKDFVEYFTPATAENYRSGQPLSLLIFLAMKDAVIERSAKSWNWGGTWLSQDGVYHFKSRWGTKDHPYRYYVTKYGDDIDLSEIRKSQLIGGYPYFFTFPFRLLAPE
ncbi:GNAT family N-acetyltransferase [Dechloromonas sp. XY25]|uniref:GNAT family N-acetyltransferase n=1 Tax=Dechloromonas hankyongensis TaxID=2908002 RepID=A0ABS9JZJ5_9RHOO|nr:GNAT family N-acetyltransferase [Dechloromonas hankyongensis]MCG2576264.1 GNAT family N-acetyltransferase [Dechloromonas hankyongensis]